MIRVRFSKVLIFAIAAFFASLPVGLDSQSGLTVGYLAEAKPKPPPPKPPKSHSKTQTVKPKATVGKVTLGKNVTPKPITTRTVAKPVTPLKNPALTNKFQKAALPTKLITKNGKNYAIPLKKPLNSVGQWKSMPAKSANNLGGNAKLKKPVPYKKQSKAFSVLTKKPEKFIRVYTPGKSGRDGQWLMRARDIKGLSPKQIHKKFAMRGKPPTHFARVTVPAGSRMLVGRVNNTNAIQYQWKLYSSKAFGNGNVLPSKFNS